MPHPNTIQSHGNDTTTGDGIQSRSGNEKGKGNINEPDEIERLIEEGNELEDERQRMIEEQSVNLGGTNRNESGSEDSVVAFSDTQLHAQLLAMATEGNGKETHFGDFFESEMHAAHEPPENTAHHHVQEEDFDTEWRQEDILAMDIDRALDLLAEYPRLDSQFHIPRDMFVRCCSALKIFTLNQFLYHFGFEETKVFVRMLQERLPPHASNTDLDTQVRRLAHELSTLVLRRPVLSISEMDRFGQRQMVLSSGCPILDKELLRGGLRTQMITEIFGEASAGKTQLVTQMLVQCCLPAEMGGLSGSSMLMFTEGSFHMDRLHQMITEKMSRWQSHELTRTLLGRNGLHRTEDFLDRIFTRNIKTLTEFEMVMERAVSMVIDQCNSGDRPIRLIVVDSIAALFRGEFEHDTRGMTERSRKLISISEQLKALATHHNICILVTNQATDKFQSERHHHGEPARSKMNRGVADLTADIIHRVALEMMQRQGQSEKSMSIFPLRSSTVKLPALGLAWSNCINVRLMMQRSQQMIRVSDSAEKVDKCNSDEDRAGSATRHEMVHLKRLHHNKRQRLTSTPAKISAQHIHRMIHVIFSPYAKSQSSSFIVDNWGVRGVVYDSRRDEYVAAAYTSDGGERVV